MSLKDILIALAVCFGWGLHVTLVRMGTLEIPPLFLLCLRFGLTILIFSPFITAMTRTQAKNLFFYALPYMGFHFITLFLSLSLMDSSLVGMILQTELPFVVLIGWFFLKEKFGLKTFIGLSLAFLGAFVLVYSPDVQGSYLGVSLAFISALAWSIGAVRMRHLDGISLPNMIFYSYAMIFPLVILATLLFETNQLEKLSSANPMTIGFILFYQACLMSIAQYFWKGLMVRNPAYLVTLFIPLCAIFTLISGVVLLDEKISLMSLFGGFITFIGVGIIVWRKSLKESQKL